MKPERLENLTASCFATLRALKFLLTALRAIGPFDLPDTGSGVNTCTLYNNKGDYIVLFIQQHQRQVQNILYGKRTSQLNTCNHSCQL